MNSIITDPGLVGTSIVSIQPNAFFNGELRSLEVPEGVSVGEIVTLAGVQGEVREFVRVNVGGDFIPARLWDRIRPKQNVPVTLYLMAAGGGNQSTGKMIGMIVAMIAVSIAAPYAGALIFGAGTLGAAIFAAGATLVATLALGALFAPPKPSSPGSITETPAFAVSGVQNSARPYGSCIRVYGRRRIAPVYAAIPYTVSRGARQDLYALFDCGYGPVDVADPKIGHTPLTRFTNAQGNPAYKYLVHPSFTAGDTLTYYARDTEQEALARRITNTAYEVVRSATGARRIICDFYFPMGLVRYADDGDAKLEDVFWTIEIRLASSTGAWTNVLTLTHSLFACLDADPWITIERATAAPFWSSVEFVVPTVDQYDVRVRRSDADQNTSSTLDVLQWSSMKTVKTTPAIRPKKPHTIIELVLEATDQLSGMLDNFNVQVTSKLVGYDGTSYTPVAATRNPAWIALDILRGTAAARPIPTSRLDLDSFRRFAQYCNQPAPNDPANPLHRFDGIIAQDTTSWEAFRTVLAVARAAPAMIGDKYGVIFDDVRANPVQVITPRNSWGFEGSIRRVDRPHAIRVTYTEPSQEEPTREVFVYDDGYNADGSNGKTPATKFEDFDLAFGVADRAQAWRAGRYLLAYGQLRPETYTVMMDPENLACPRGSWIKFSHDVPRIGGKAARVKELTGTIGDGVTIVTLDDRIEWVNQNFWQARRPAASAARSSGNINDILAVDQFSIAIDRGDIDLVVGDLIIVGESETITKDLIVKSVSPDEEGNARLTFEDYAPAIFDADSGLIPDYDPGITGIRPGAPPPAPVNFTARQDFYVIGGYPYTTIQLTWTPAPGPRPAMYEIYRMIDDRWQLVGTTTSNNFSYLKDLALIDERGNPIDLIGEHFYFALVALGVSGQRLPIADCPQVDFILQNDPTIPEDVSILWANLTNTSTVTLYWLRVRDPDIAQYVIRYSPLTTPGVTWDDMREVARVSSETDFATLPARVGTYGIKALDRAGNYSLNAATTVVNFDIQVDEQNTYLIKDDPTWPGTHDNTVKVGNYLELAQSSPGVYEPEGFYIYDDLIDLGLNYADVGLANRTQSYGVAYGVTMSTWVPLEIAVPLESVLITGTEAIAMVSTSIDNVTWTPWQPIERDTISGRYFKFGLALSTSQPSCTPRVALSDIGMFFAARSERGIGINVPATGLTINFVNPFFSRPAIFVTIIGGDKNDIITVTGATATGFTVTINRAGGAGVASVIDWVATGYGTKSTIQASMMAGLAAVPAVQPSPHIYRRNRERPRNRIRHQLPMIEHKGA